MSCSLALQYTRISLHVKPERVKSTTPGTKRFALHVIFHVLLGVACFLLCVCAVPNSHLIGSTSKFTTSGLVLHVKSKKFTN